MLEQFVITEEGTVEEAALALLGGYTIGQVRAAIAAGAVRVNGAAARRDAEAEPGDILEVDTDALGAPRIEPREGALSIAFEDASLIAVDKPAGVAVVPERGAEEWAFMGMLAHHARHCDFCDASTRYRIVHRLDRDTTGVVVVVKTAEAERALSAHFAARTVEKRYLAVVAGDPGEDEGTIDAPIGRSPRGPARMAVRADGKPSVTDWRVVERFRGYAFVEARPHTGRTHQIRVHLAWAGMPLAVDPLYGGPDALYLSAFKRRYHRTGPEKPLVSRLTLHCASLAFEHPDTHERIEISAPLPPDFERALKALRKHAARRGS